VGADGVQVERLPRCNAFQVEFFCPIGLSVLNQMFRPSVIKDSEKGKASAFPAASLISTCLMSKLSAIVFIVVSNKI
jgi:hypothetical protein